MSKPEAAFLACVLALIAAWAGSVVLARVVSGWIS